MDKQLRANTTADKHRALKAWCSQREVTIQSVINKLIDGFLTDPVMQDIVLKELINEEGYKHE